MKYLYFTLFLSLISLKIAYCQVKSATPTLFVDSGIVLWDYSSKIIGEDYTLYVNVPSGYDTTKTNYPVLYMTDGDWNITTSIDCFSMLDQDYETIDPIIVGIGYGKRPNMRGRDLDPATGGPKFLAFIEKEVIPFIKSKYRVNDNKALYGYSYGGLFTTSVLFDHPGLFNTIFIGAPGNDGEDLIPAAKKYFTDHKDLDCKVFLGVGSFEQVTANNIVKFKTYLLKQRCKKLDIKTVIIPDAAHGAAVSPVMESAIKFGYCKTHKPINLTTRELKKYTGNYTSAEAVNVKFKLYVNNNKLYFQQGKLLPVQYVPYTRDRFFMREREMADISFKQTSGKMYMLFSRPNEKPHRLNRIN